MASIHKLPSGNWRVQVRRKGRAISKTFAIKPDAKEWAQIIEGNQDHLEAFPDAEARRRTLTDAIDGYMNDYTGRDRSVVARLTFWKDRYGHMPLADFRSATIKEGVRSLSMEAAKRQAGYRQVSLGRRKSPATLNRYLQSVSSVLSWAVEQDWITKNPALGMKRKKEPRGLVRFLSDDERKALLEACDQSDWKDLGLLVRMALSTGARHGEIMGIRWEDVDLKRGIVHIGNTKNDEPRQLPLIDPILMRLKEKPRPIQGGYLFHPPNDPGKPFKGMRPHWDNAIRKAGIEKFRFHDLRHSCASYLAMNGASPLEIGDVLGHKTLAMVRRYSHLATDHKAKLTERVFTRLVE